MCSVDTVHIVQSGQREQEQSYRVHVYVYICVLLGLFLHCENYTVSLEDNMA